MSSLTAVGKALSYYYLNVFWGDGIPASTLISDNHLGIAALGGKTNPYGFNGSGVIMDGTSLKPRYAQQCGAGENQYKALSEKMLFSEVTYQGIDFLNVQTDILTLFYNFNEKKLSLMKSVNYKVYDTTTENSTNSPKNKIVPINYLCPIYNDGHYDSTISFTWSQFFDTWKPLAFEFGGKWNGNQIYNVNGQVIYNDFPYKITLAQVQGLPVFEMSDVDFGFRIDSKPYCITYFSVDIRFIDKQIHNYGSPTIELSDYYSIEFCDGDTIYSKLNNKIINVDISNTGYEFRNTLEQYYNNNMKNNPASVFNFYICGDEGYYIWNTNVYPEFESLFWNGIHKALLLIFGNNIFPSNKFRKSGATNDLVNISEFFSYNHIYFSQDRRGQSHQKATCFIIPDNKIQKSTNNAGTLGTVLNAIQNDSSYPYLNNIFSFEIRNIYINISAKPKNVVYNKSFNGNPDSVNLYRNIVNWNSLSSIPNIYINDILYNNNTLGSDVTDLNLVTTSSDITNVITLLMPPLQYKNIPNVLVTSYSYSYI